MNIIDLLQNIKRIDDYINVTHEINDNKNEFQLHLNSQTVHTIKQLQAFEIEYLNKSYGNGAATIVFDRLLKFPPGRDWAETGRELVAILRYWLDAVRKHLIHHSSYWWSFLQLILKFINNMLYKDVKSVSRTRQSIADHLAEVVAECLFDLATNDKTDVQQKYEILHCLNRFSALCNRDLRLAQLGDFDKLYFVKVGELVYGSGFVPLQGSALEALVRWLVKRASAAVRAHAAARWFPAHACPQTVRDGFVSSTWTTTYFEESRHFLNTVNNFKGEVVSVVCKRLLMGDHIIVEGSEKYQIWLDINTKDKSLSVLLPSRIISSDVSEALYIHNDNTAHAQLLSGSSTSGVGALRLVVQSAEPCALRPSRRTLAQTTQVSLTVRPTDVDPFNRALRTVFREKYQVLMDVNSNVQNPSPTNNRARISSDEDTRFSLPTEKHRLRFGPSPVIINTINNARETPSSTSTTSLAQLHDKLKALPNVNPFEKGAGIIRANPQLPTVTEVSEGDDKSFHSMSTFKLPEPNNSCQNPTGNKRPAAHPTQSSQPHTDGQTDDMEPLNPEMVDQLVNEALNSQPFAETEVIESTPNVAIQSRAKEVLTPDLAIPGPAPAKLKSQLNAELPVNPKAQAKSAVSKKVCTVISTTDDDSTTEAFTDTSVFTSRKGKFGKLLRKQYASKDTKKPKTNPEMKVPLEPNVIILQPKDAKHKVSNKDLFEQSQALHDENAVVECLNDLVTRVSDDIDKCIMYLDKDCDRKKRDKANKKTLFKIQEGKAASIKLKFNRSTAKIESTKAAEKSDDVKEVSSPVNKIVTKGRSKQAKTKSGKNQSTIAKNKDVSACSIKKDTPYLGNTDSSLKKRKGKLYSPKLSEVIEQRNSTIESPKEPISNSDSETPLIKRRRKLYSPKDEIFTQKEGYYSHEDDVPLSKSNVSKYKDAGSIYSDLEKERRNRPKRKLTKKRFNLEDPPSPRTLKMNAAFESAKSLASNEKIVLAESNKANVYNYNSSDSDKDFDVKNKKIRAGPNTTAVKTEGKTTAKKNKRKSIADENEKPKRPRKVPVKRTRSKAKLKISPIRDLNDERMREATPVALHTVVVDKPITIKPLNLEPKLRDPPQMEFIEDEGPNEINKKKRAKKDVKYSIQFDDKDTSKTSSPLPTLVVETASDRKLHNDSLNISKLKQLLKVYAENPDALNISTNTQNTLLDNDKPVDVDEEICICDPNILNSPEKLRPNFNTRSETEQMGIKTSNKNAQIYDNEIVSEIVDMIDKSESLRVGDNTDHGALNDQPQNVDVFEKTNYQLNEELDNSVQNSNSNISRLAKVNMSPVVSLQRLSLEDINRYLPSQRSSESDQSSLRGSSKPSMKSKEASPVDFARLSLDQFWQIPNAKDKPSTKDKRSKVPEVIAENSQHSYGTRSKSKIREMSPKREISRNASIDSRRQLNRETSSQRQADVKTKSRPARKLCVSPLKDFTEFSTNKPKHKIDIFDSRVAETLPSKPIKLVYQTESRERQRISQSKRLEESPSLTPSKRRLEDSVIRASASSTSVSEWLRTSNKASSGAKEQSFLVKDTLQGVLEAVDTFVAENSDNNNKKIGDLLADVQKQLNEIDEEVTQVNNEFVAKMERIENDIKSFKVDFVSAMQKSREKQSQIMENLKRRSSEVLQSDYKQKRAMVAILKEDVQAVIEHINKGGK